MLTCGRTGDAADLPLGPPVRAARCPIGQPSTPPPVVPVPALLTNLVPTVSGGGEISEETVEGPDRSIVSLEEFLQGLSLRLLLLSVCTED